MILHESSTIWDFEAGLAILHHFLSRREAL